MSYTNYFLPKKNIQEIYCDESGFTGNNLLDAKDTYFSYAAVAVNHEEAKEFVDRVINDYKVQSNELKFSKLIKYSRGQEAITYIFKTFHERMKVIVCHKKYSLAGKFYEYIFEPTIASINSLFYDTNFHRFIANALYLEFQLQKKYAEEIFEDFYKLMKVLTYENLNYMFTYSNTDENSPFIQMVKTFCICHKKIINEELESLKGFGVGKWTLDLTVTSLASILFEQGLKFQQMDVFCDDSKPLQAQHEVFNAFVNCKKRIYMESNGEKHPIGCNLTGPIKLVDSRQYPGIQIADVASGMFTFAFKEMEKGNFSQYPIEWTEYLLKSISGYSIMPDIKYLDVNNISVQRNLSLLKELVYRSTNEISLIEGMAEFIQLLTYIPFTSL